MVKMREKQGIKQRLAALFCCALIIMIVEPAFAQLNLFDSRAFYHHMLHSEDSGLGLLPIRLMDDETLLHAAAMRRDASMSTEFRVINALWLIDGHNGFADRNHSKQLMRDNLETLLLGWSGLSSQHDAARADNEHEHIPALFDMSNYRVRLSHDSVFLRFKYRFD